MTAAELSNGVVPLSRQPCSSPVLSVTVLSLTVSVQNIWTFYRDTSSCFSVEFSLRFFCRQSREVSYLPLVHFPFGCIRYPTPCHHEGPVVPVSLVVVRLKRYIQRKLPDIFRCQICCVSTVPFTKCTGMRRREPWVFLCRVPCGVLSAFPSPLPQ